MLPDTIFQIISLTLKELVLMIVFFAQNVLKTEAALFPASLLDLCTHGEISRPFRKTFPSAPTTLRKENNHDTVL